MCVCGRVWGRGGGCLASTRGLKMGEICHPHLQSGTRSCKLCPQVVWVPIASLLSPTILTSDLWAPPKTATCHTTVKSPTTMFAVSKVAEIPSRPHCDHCSLQTSVSRVRRQSGSRRKRKPLLHWPLWRKWRTIDPFAKSRGNLATAISSIRASVSAQLGLTRGAEREEVRVKHSLRASHRTHASDAFGGRGPRVIVNLLFRAFHFWTPCLCSLS